MKRLALALVLAAALVLWAVPVGAFNPTVTITISAQIVSITNSEDTWTIGTVVINDVKYFSADNLKDDDYSLITNTGNVAVDVKIQGQDFVATNVTFNWVLAAAAGNQTYSLYATNQTLAPTYSIEVKKASYEYVAWDLPATGSDTCTWSMELTAPNEFHAQDDGGNKVATITLVASKH